MHAETTAGILKDNNKLAHSSVHLISGRNVFICPLIFESDAQKKDILKNIKYLAKRVSVETAVVVMDTWLVMTSEAEYYSGNLIRPMHHPERKDAVVISYEVEGFYTARHYLVNRDENGNFLELAPLCSDEDPRLWKNELLDDRGMDIDSRWLFINKKSNYVAQ